MRHFHVTAEIKIHRDRCVSIKARQYSMTDYFKVKHPTDCDNTCLIRPLRQEQEKP